MPPLGLLSQTIGDDYGDGGIVAKAEMTASHLNVLVDERGANSDARQLTMASVRLYTDVVGMPAVGRADQPAEFPA